MAKTPQRKPAPKTRISFRLDRDLAEQLSQQAAQANRSEGIEARSIVTAALQKPDDLDHKLEMLRSEVGELRDEVVDLLETLRSDLVTSVSILLSKAGHVTPDQAQQWVKQTLLDD
jgi:hypothetical protein